MASSRVDSARLSTTRPSSTTASHIPFARRAPDQSIAITVGSVTPRRYRSSMAAEVVLEARGLVKDYRRDRAVDGVDLVVHAGERVALLGPNGAGKTTTLLMILGEIGRASCRERV